MVYSVQYPLGSSNVDAPMSRPEATRTMNILKEASSEESCFNQAIHILLSRDSTGDLELIDSNTNSVLASFPVKAIRFCCRGTEELVKDCFAFTVKHPLVEGNGSFQCHVIKVIHFIPWI